MGVSIRELEELSQELRIMQDEIAWIQSILEEQGLLPIRPRPAEPRAELWPSEGEEWTSDHLARLDANLATHGLLSHPTAEEIARVKAYEAEVPLAERQRIRKELRQLKLDPPLSEVIRRMREGWSGSDWPTEIER
jgi:hypothetical protein